MLVCMLKSHLHTSWTFSQLSPHFIVFSIPFVFLFQVFPAKYSSNQQTIIIKQLIPFTIQFPFSSLKVLIKKSIHPIKFYKNDVSLPMLIALVNVYRSIFYSVMAPSAPDASLHRIQFSAYDCVMITIAVIVIIFFFFFVFYSLSLFPPYHYYYYAGEQHNRFPSVFLSECCQPRKKNLIFFPLPFPICSSFSCLFLSTFCLAINILIGTTPWSHSL